MRLFEIRPDPDYPHNYYLNASHRWGLPGVKCDVCGWRGGGRVGLAYPKLTLPAGLDPKPYLKRWPVSPARLQELIAPLRPLLDPSLPIEDGTEFGPVCGTGYGKFGDFTWLNSWTPFISPEALEKLRACGIGNLSTQPAEIKLRGKRQFEHLELCLEPRVKLDPAYSATAGLERCGVCGKFLPQPPPPTREEGVRQVCERPVVLGDSFPKGLHLVRVLEWPAKILATEQFVNCVRELKLTDITFEEVQVT